MDIYTVIGAILGSGLFIFAGRAPAERVLAAIKSRRRPSR